MPKSTKHKAQPDDTDSTAQPKKDDNSEHDRAPYQKDKDRDPVKSAEETRKSPLSMERSNNLRPYSDPDTYGLKPVSINGG